MDQPKNGNHIIMRKYHRVPLEQLSEKKKVQQFCEVIVLCIYFTYFGQVSLAVVAYFIRSDNLEIKSRLTLPWFVKFAEKERS